MGKERIYICKTCNSSYKCRQNLHRHEITHQLISFSCSCGKLFNRKDNMLRHKLKCSGSSTDRKCSIYGVEFAKTSNFKGHSYYIVTRVVLQRVVDRRG